MPSHYLNQLLSNASLGTNFGENWFKIQQFFFSKNAFEIIVCHERPYLFRSRSVNDRYCIIWFSIPLVGQARVSPGGRVGSPMCVLSFLSTQSLGRQGQVLGIQTQGFKHPSHSWVFLPLDKMATTSQMIFSYAFSWMKSFVVWLKFDWGLFPRVQLTITQHWFR